MLGRGDAVGVGDAFEAQDSEMFSSDSIKELILIHISTLIGSSLVTEATAGVEVDAFFIEIELAIVPVAIGPVLFVGCSVRGIDKDAWASFGAMLFWHRIS